LAVSLRAPVSSEMPFDSAPPIVRLANVFARPYENAVATARTCYSGRGIVTEDEVSGVGLDAQAAALRAEQRDRIAASTYRAGHHTILQHAHVQFAIDRVSRHFVWSFLHAHPFYNSEQTSQRFVEVRPGHVAIPRLPGAARAIYAGAVDGLMEDYRALNELLAPTVEEAYFEIFPVRRKRADVWRRALQKKTQEIARYVLPVATHTTLYHTVSVLTLLRYWRVAASFDTPAETRVVVGEMLRQLLAQDPMLATLVQSPLDAGALPEQRALDRLAMDDARHASEARAQAQALDAALGGRTSRLVDRFASNERRVAEAVREVLGVGETCLSDDEAIASALAPDRNALLGEALNLTTLSKLSRALGHAHYVFQKRLSHTADSQDQRHRMTPGSRPILPAYLGAEPDYITPTLVRAASDAAQSRYRTAMDRAWTAIDALARLGVPAEWRAYLLPNAVTIRFSESADLLHLRHKLAMRLCYNAQEEIWQASVDEAADIAALEPRIGRHLLPPCGVRFDAGARPICPEGDRYCGVQVWKLARRDWRRLI